MVISIEKNFLLKIDNNWRHHLMPEITKILNKITHQITSKLISQKLFNSIFILFFD